MLSVCENVPQGVTPSFTIFNPDGSVHAEKSTTGVTEIFSGVYAVDHAAIAGRIVVWDAAGFSATDDTGLIRGRTDRIPDTPAAVTDVASAAEAVIAAIPPSAAPEEWSRVTQDTPGTDGHALGRVPAHARVVATLGGAAMYETTADADGDFSMPLPSGSTWTLVATAPGYRTTRAEVAT